MTVKLLLGNNLDVMNSLHKDGLKFNLIYADMMYDDFDFTWIDFCKEILSDDGSIFIQTDYRSVAELKLYLDELFGKSNFVNWIIWPYNWGGRSKRRFARKHDDILWYSKTEEYKFYPDRVAIPKKTLSKGFNPSGRTTTIPTDVWNDIGNFHTMSKERVKDYNGKNIKWQKPLSILDRIILSTTDENDWVLDPFLGSGTTAVSCINHDRNFVGIEIKRRILRLAKQRIKSLLSTYENSN